MDNTYTKKNSLRIRSNLFACVVRQTFQKGYPAVLLMRLYWGKKEQDAGMVNVSSKSLNA